MARVLVGGYKYYLYGMSNGTCLWGAAVSVVSNALLLHLIASLRMEVSSYPFRCSGMKGRVVQESGFLKGTSVTKRDTHIDMWE